MNVNIECVLTNNRELSKLAGYNSREIKRLKGIDKSLLF